METIDLETLAKKFILTTPDKDSFLLFNHHDQSTNLSKGKKYKMPIRVYSYSDINIRKSVGVDDYGLAKSIQVYNETLIKLGLKKTALSKGGDIWVPLNYLKGDKLKFVPHYTKYALLGKNDEIEVTDNLLKNQVFYLISGHGGPDPGANCIKDGNMVCEDEYAYDITLRLARNLISHSGKVYMIVSDKNDGIREDTYLKHDHDEVTCEGDIIPLNQIKRLKQRTDLINKLYKEHEGNSKQKLIEIHIDSRNEDKKIDLFFYHFIGSEAGKKVAEHLLETIKEKYNTHQKDRGYNGVVEARNLYSLRETLPLSIYIEVGNITNDFDQRRILIPNNRQALANWLAEGLMK